MTPEVLRSILDLKSAMMERQSNTVAKVRRELEARENLILALERSIGEVHSGLECGADLQASVRFKSAQSQRLGKVRQSVAEVTGRLHAEQEKLRRALAEKRAVERLSEMAVGKTG